MQLFYDWDAARLRRAWASELSDPEPPVREARLLELMLERYPIRIEEGDLFAWRYGFETREALEACYVPEPAREIPDELRPIDRLYLNGCLPIAYDRAHHEIDYGEALRTGVNGLIEKVETERKKPDNSPEKAQMLAGMRIALGAAERFAGRYADLAGKQAAEARDESARTRLLRIEAACRKVPMQPAEDFFEALQSIWILWSIHCISYTFWASVSLGSFDRYLYPYYRKSRENGMSEDEAIELLRQFFRMLDAYGGMDCALSVGGADASGNDATNELSRLIVRAEKRSLLRAPLFCVRVNRNTPPEFLREVICKELFAIGQPSFYSEENCLASLVRRGVPEDIARGYQISTCMAFVIPDREALSGWGCMLNTHLPLELALNGGKPLRGELGLALSPPPRSTYTCADEIFDQYRSYLREIFAVWRDFDLAETRRLAREIPNPWLSAWTKDCIGRGKDRWDGGAVYHNIVVEMMAFANTADAITAIEELVFAQGKYTIADIVRAAQVGYVGCGSLRRDLLACSKYGTGNPHADANARRLLDINAEICEESRAENRRYLPSLHTLWHDAIWGKDRYAFLDGRGDGEPVNKNAGPTLAARGAGPTRAALSACKIDQIRYSGGQALDVHIGLRNLDSDTNKDKIAAYLRTYFDLGGLLLQVNGLTSETLQKAYDDPKSYPDLIVRIGGHSRYFNEFPDEAKREFIRRFALEEQAAGV